MIKLILSPRTKRNMTRAQLRHHLEFTHGPLCLAHEEVGGHFRQYVHHYVLDGYEGPLGEQLMPGRDAVTCIWFEDDAALEASLTSEAFHRYIGPDEDNFRELDGSIGFKAREWVVTKPVSSPDRKLFAFRRAGGAVEEAAARWAAVLSAALRSENAHPIASCVVNSVELAYSSSDFNLVDELGFCGEAAASPVLELYRTLERRHFGQLRSQMLITEPKVFKSF